MLDSLFQESTDQALQDRVDRPLDPVTKPSGFSVWRTTKAPFMGVAAGGLESVAMGAELLGAFGAIQGGMGIMADPAMLFDSDMRDVVRGEKGKSARAKAGGTDLFNTETGTDLRTTARSFMPDPATSNVVEDVLFGLGRFGAKAIGYSVATGNPFAGAALTGVDEGMTEADKLRSEGVDFQTRARVGAVAGVSAAAATVLPVAGKTIKGTVALTVAGGPAAFIAQQAASRAILENADYASIAEQYDPFDPVGLAVSTLIPAAFGGYAMRGIRKAEARAAMPLQDLPRNERVKLRYNDPRMDDYAVTAAEREGVPAELMLALKNAGEKSNPEQVSPKGAGGVAQLMPENQAKYGVTDAADPVQSIDGMAKYLRDTMKHYDGNIQAVIADYNGGPRQAKAVQDGKVPPAKETQAYLTRVNQYLAENQGKRAGKEVANDPDAVAAARVNLSRESLESTSLYRPDDFTGRTEHVEAVARAADQIGAGERVNVADVINAERIELSKAYDLVKALPTGDKFDPLVMIRPEDMEAVAISRGGFKGNGDVEIKGSGFGLAKFIWKHGEKSSKKPEFQISKDDILSFPNVIREFEPTVTPHEGGSYREWHVDLPDGKGTPRRVVFTDKTMGDDGRHMISAFVQEPGRKGADHPLSKRKADLTSESPSMWSDTKEWDTQPNVLHQVGQKKSAEGSIAENPAIKSSLDSQVSEIANLSPDLMVRLDGMETARPMSEVLAEIKAEAAKDKQDAPLLQVAAECFLRNN